MKDLPKLAKVKEAEYLSTPNEFIDCVVLEPDDFKAIFGKRRSRVKDSEKTLAVVKIKSALTGKTIYRSYLGEMALKGTGLAAVTHASINQLNDGTRNNMVKSDVLLSKGNPIPFYWNNPNYALRTSIRVGTFSVFLAVLSIILSICL